MRKGYAIAAAVLAVLLIVSWWRFSSPPEDSAPPSPTASATGPTRQAPRGAGTVLQPETAEDVGARGSADAGSTPTLALAPSEADGVLEVEVLAGDKPVAGASVRLYWRGARDPNLDEISWRLASTDRTDGTGRARLPSRPGAYLVAVRAEGLAPRVRDVVRPYGEALTRLRLTLEAGQSLTGRTVVQGTNEPLPLVELVLTAHGRKLELWQSPEAPAEERLYATSNERGDFRLDGLAPGEYQLEASAPGHARTLRRSVRIPASGPLTVALPRAATLEGFVVDAQGQPAAGAEVQVSGRGAPQQVTTGEGGGFSVEVASGAHTVSARRGAEAGSLDKPVVVGAGRTVRDVRVRLGAGASIEGRVVARAGKTPVAGASVDISPADSAGDSGRTTTDGAGAFAVRGLAPGSYDVSVNAPGYSQLIRRGLTVAAGERFPVEVELAGTGAVAGVVRDAAGQPVEGVLVRGGDRWGGGLGTTAAEARTDTEGRYELGGLTAGRAQLSARREGAAVGVTQQVEVVEGGTARADFTLTDTGTVEGVVRAASGPLPDEPLVVAAIPGQRGRVTPADIGRADVDGAGHFRMVLPPGTYNLTIQRGVPGFSTPVPVRVEAGQTARTELTLDAPEREEGTQVRGRVVEADGSPSARAMVQVSMEGPERGARIMAPADEEGHFQYGLTAEMAQGPLRITARNGGRSGTVGGVKPGVGEVLVRMQPSASVRGKVVRTQGPPVRGFRLSLRAVGEMFPMGNSGWEFAGEHFELKDVPGERVKLTARTTDGAGGEVEVALSPGASVEVEIPLRGMGGVRGRVVDAAGAPVSGAFLFVEGLPRMDANNETGPDGRFQLEGLSPGEHRLNVRTFHGARAERKVTLAEGQVLDVGDLALEAQRSPPGSIGANLVRNGQQVVVSYLVQDGPAARAGVLLGDVLLAVDGAPVTGLENAQERLRGAPGSPVTVRVKRGGAEQTLSIVRAT
jgi:protocatechuate 3,4-dioxygenase beta subunit